MRYLDVVLNGAVGLERSGYRVDGVPSLLFGGLVLDDSEYLERQHEAAGFSVPAEPDPRRGFLGG